MKSIRVRIMAAIIVFSVLTGLIVGVTTIYTSSGILERYSRDNASLTAANAAGGLDRKMGAIQTSVDGLAISALALLDDVKRFKMDKAYVRKYEETLRPIAKQFAQSTEGAMSFYIRFNPAFTEPTSGIFHADSNGDGSMEQLTPTDFSQYDPSDTEHVGWYYIPVKNGKAMWLDPYRNENIKVDMISYTVPLFKDGESIGIVGMDIRFDIFQKLLAGIKPFDSSYGILLNSNGKILIDPVHPKASLFEDIDKPLAEEVRTQSTGVTTTILDGKESLVSYAKLSGGYTLLIATLTSDIYREVTGQTHTIVLLIVGVLAVAVCTALIVGARVTKPLFVIVEDMRKVSDGDLTVRSPYTGTHEIGRIGSGFNEMVTHLADLTGSIKGMSGHIRQASDALFSVSEDATASTRQITVSVAEIAQGSQSQAVSIEQCAQFAAELAEKCEALRVSTDGVWQETLRMNAGNENSLTFVQGLEDKNEGNRQATERIGRAITELADKMQSINRIMETISGVTNQTAILALNASIEAARAGEAGRGFAVVAAEVRKLAEQSRVATDDTITLITSVQEDVAHTVTAMSEVKERNLEQSEAVVQMSEAFRAMSESVKESTRRIAESGRYIEDLSRNAALVKEQLENISAISEESTALSQQVAATVEEQARDSEKVAAAAEELSGLVGRLDEVVKAFRLEAGNSRH